MASFERSSLTDCSQVDSVKCHSKALPTSKCSSQSGLAFADLSSTQNIATTLSISKPTRRRAPQAIDSLSGGTFWWLLLLQTIAFFVWSCARGFLALKCSTHSPFTKRMCILISESAHWQESMPHSHTVWSILASSSFETRLNKVLAEIWQPANKRAGCDQSLFKCNAAKRTISLAARRHSHGNTGTNTCKPPTYCMQLILWVPIVVEMQRRALVELVARRNGTNTHTLFKPHHSPHCLLPDLYVRCVGMHSAVII